MLQRSRRTGVALVAVAWLVTACAAQPTSNSAGAPTAAIPAATQAATQAPIAAPTSAPAATQAATQAPIAAPTSAPAATQAATPAGVVGVPQFTHSTEITNPFYPVSLTGRTIALGQEGGKPSRNEVVLLPDTKMISWNGQQIEARVTQFVAYTDGQLVEVAYDYFAQADDGSVYYLGEDVSNFEDGKFVSHEGSWLTGKDGAPAALIMPANPAIGKVFNPENLPGVVFESDEIISLSQHTTTPAGPTDRGMLVKETLMDGSIEHKVYAADYGIIEEQADDEQVNLVLYNRSDAKAGTVPTQVSAIEAQAEDIIDVVPVGDWGQVATDVAVIAQAWQSYQAQVASDHVPAPFRTALAAALGRLQKVSAVKQATATLQAANDLSAALIDLYAVYHPVLPTDVGQLDVLERQVVLDLAAKNFDAALNSLAKLDAVWARLKPVVTAHNGADVATQFEASLADQQQALSAAKGPAITMAAKNGLELVDAIERLF